METFSVIIFVFVFIVTCLWQQISLLWGSFGKKKNPVTPLTNTRLSKLLKKKTGLNLNLFKISESQSPFAMMIGIPGLPQLIFSRNLYENFDSDELEYVILHEAGHYVLAHTLKESLLGLVLFVFGMCAVYIGQIPLILAMFLGLFLGILIILYGRHNELEADTYSLKRVSNPQGMISATSKFQHHYKTNSLPKLVQFLFYRGNPYSNRIRMAKHEIESRKFTTF